MPKVTQDHLDARRQQIIDAARRLFATQGFARTSMSDLVNASGLSNGAIYRYFASKDEIITAICDQATHAFPADLTPDVIHRFLQHIRALAREENHARLVAQIYAEAAVSPALGDVVKAQLDQLRSSIVGLLPDREPVDAQQIAEAFVALCHGYTQQLAVRGDVDPSPYAAALVRIAKL
ncbi:TetR/AcrR family transcriptional regulator [Gordonia sp. DT30]|uniref:TetR/AcrR family transcriptional regulator n=1 Tax=Gordonia sp. DT30 TaxID=3416546 RepID=UPI003CEAF840